MLGCTVKKNLLVTASCRPGFVQPCFNVFPNQGSETCSRPFNVVRPSYASCCSSESLETFFNILNVFLPGLETSLAPLASSLQNTSGNGIKF